MSQRYLSEFRVQTLRIENYESISCVTLSIYSATTDGGQTATSQVDSIARNGDAPSNDNWRLVQRRLL